MFAQFNAAKNFVVERETLEMRNSGTMAVSEVVVCHPSDLTPSRAFFEVRYSSFRAAMQFGNLSE